MPPTEREEPIQPEQVATLARWIVEADHVVAFTGAGISTESGLPDFRGPDGVWTRRDKGLPPPTASKPWSEVEPNRGHRALVRLQALDKLDFVVSQNVDNLHLKSGIHAGNIAELHGNSTLMRCLECDQQFPKRGLWDERKWGKGYRTSKPRPGQPACPECGGRIISSVVNFGDPLPGPELDRSFEEARQADVMLVVGSSLVVTPAADVPRVARQAGAKLVIVNKGKTPLDADADLRIWASAGEYLTRVVDRVEAAL